MIKSAVKSKPKVLVTAPVGTRSGYGSRSRDIVRALVSLDKYDVAVNPVPWGNTPQNALDKTDEKDLIIINRIRQVTEKPDVHIHIVVPNEFASIGTYNIGITAGLETTLIPQPWIEGCNRMDLVLTSSAFAKDSMVGTEYTNSETQESLKVETPVEVLFEGADLETYFPTSSCSKILADEMEKIETDWNYLFVGHWLQGALGHDRKDVGMLVKVFMETFSDKSNVGLILKTSGATPSIMDIEDISRKIFEIKSTVKNPNPPSVYFMSADLHDSEMNDLYNHPKVKAHISFTHGEGFGRPLLEASLSEKPVLVPKFSGHVDFLRGKQQKWLPGGLINVEQDAFPDGMWIEGQQWFGVNYGAAADMMKHLKFNYRKAKLWAKKLAANNRSKFSMRAMEIKLNSILDSKLPEFTQTVGLNLPKLNLPKLEKVKE